MAKCKLLCVIGVVMTMLLNHADTVQDPYADHLNTDYCKANNSADSCCQPCTYSDLCSLAEACCPDKEINKTTIIYSSYPCLSQTDIIHNYLNITSVKPSVASKFRIVTKCHALENARATTTDIDEAISRCSKAKTVEDIVFVSSVTTGITYLNKHCAICNGETHYRNWVLYLAKEQILEGIHSVETRDKYILSNGDVIALPPTEGSLRLAKCHSYTISKCNVTSLWNVYNRELEMRCSFSTETVYYEQVFGGVTGVRIYKNVFCYLCNIPSSTKPEMNCNDTLKIDFTTHVVLKTLPSYFTAVLVYKKEQSETTNIIRTCSSMEVLEKLNDRCVRLLCPPWSYPLNGNCEAIFDDVSGYSVRFLFEITISDDVHLSQLDMKFILSDLVSYMGNVVNANGTDCKICKADLVSLPLDEIAFRITFTSTRKCSHFHYIERISKIFHNSTIKVYSKFHSTNINLRGVYKNDSHPTEPNILSVIRLPLTCYSQVPHTESMVHCPSIDLLESDIFAHQFQSRLLREILLKALKIDERTLRFCFSDYEKIVDLALTSAGHIYYDAVVNVNVLAILVLALEKIF